MHLHLKYFGLCSAKAPIFCRLAVPVDVPVVVELYIPLKNTLIVVNMRCYGATMMQCQIHFNEKKVSPWKLRLSAVQTGDRQYYYIFNTFYIVFYLLSDPTIDHVVPCNFIILSRLP